MSEDVEFLDKFAKKREDFFKQMKPDEEIELRICELERLKEKRKKKEKDFEM